MKQQRHTTVSPQRVIAAVAISALVTIAACNVTPVYFWGNDDTIMQAIMSGSTSGQPTPYAIFTNIITSSFISLLFTIAPGIPWWLYFLETNIFISIAAFSFATLTLLRQMKTTNLKPCWRFILSLIISTLFFWYFVVRPSYTFTAISLASASIACYLVSLLCLGLSPSGRKGLTVAAILLIIASTCIRQYCGAIGIAFIVSTYAFVALHKHVKMRSLRSSEEAPGSITPILVIIVLALICWFVNTAAYSMGEWKDFSETNNARSTWMDFHRYSYEDEPELYQAEGWDENLYTLVYTWFFMDERVSKEAFETLAGNGEPPSFGALVSDFAHGTGMFSHTYPLGLIATLISLVAIVIVVGRRKWPVVLVVIPTAASLIGLFILWYIQRTYMHVLTCALFPSVVYCFLLSLLIGSEKPNRPPSVLDVLFVAIYTLAIAIMLVIIVPRYVDIRYRLFIVTLIPIALFVLSLMRKASKNVFHIGVLVALTMACLFSSASAYIELENDDAFRRQLEATTSDLRDYANAHPADFFVFHASLYSDNPFEMTPKNAISWGGWEYYAPWRSIVASSIGHPDGIYVDVLLDDNAYFVTIDNSCVDRIYDLLSSRNDEQITVEQIAQMDSGTAVYKYSAEE